jgi:hypothetical protein
MSNVKIGGNHIGFGLAGADYPGFRPDNTTKM